MKVASFLNSLDPKVKNIFVENLEEDQLEVITKIVTIRTENSPSVIEVLLTDIQSLFEIAPQEDLEKHMPDVPWETVNETITAEIASTWFVDYEDDDEF